MNSQNSLQLAKMQNSSQEARDYAFKMEAVKKNLMPPVDKEKKLRESCEGFESIFIQKMWEQMRATVPDGGLLKGREEKFWQGMYDQELAKTMTKAGGIGLADMMYEQLSRNLRTASKNTADAAGGRPSGFAADIAPAPLKGTETAVAQTTAPPLPAAPAAQSAAAPAKPVAPAGLYSEAAQPAASAHLADRTGQAGHAVQPDPSVSGEAATENGTDPAIIAVLNQLRSAHQAAAAAAGMQGPVSTAPALGARPPLPPMHEGRHIPLPGEPLKTTHVSTLGKTVRKPPAGSRNVMPRADSGPRVPTGSPVNRNLPFAMQETLRAQAQNQLQGSQAIQPAATGAIPGPLASGDNSIGVEALNAFAAQQKNTQIAPMANAPISSGAGGRKTGG